MLKAEEENLTFTTANRIGTLNAVCGQISTQRESSARLEFIYLLFIYLQNLPSTK